MRRRVRASDLRAQADEMAALLDRAAPQARRQRHRRATALPAAVAAFGALSVGGVGLALGLTPTGAEGQLPAAPWPVLADPGTGSATTTAGGAPETADLDPAVAGADLIRPDDRTAPAPGPGSPGRPAPSSGTRSTTAATSTTTSTPRPTRSTTPRPTKPPRPTGSRSATPRSTAPSSTAAPRPVAQRSASTPPTTRGAATHLPDPTTGPAVGAVGEDSPTPEE